MRVLTFSRTYPGYHPKAGEPTYFVEKIHYNIWGTVSDEWMDAQSMIYDLNKHLPRELVFDFVESLEMEIDFNDFSKGHTIRAGHRWKEGDWFSPRVWSGKPYASKQIQFAPPIQVKKVWSFSIGMAAIYIDQQRWIDKSFIAKVSANDGLDYQDFLDWFQYPKPFTGQIICWNESIEY